jgi:hypothetical protein
MEKYFITPCHMAHFIQSILFLPIFVILSYCILFHNGLKMDCHNVLFLFHANLISPMCVKSIQGPLVVVKCLDNNYHIDFEHVS